MDCGIALPQNKLADMNIIEGGDWDRRKERGVVKVHRAPRSDPQKTGRYRELKEIEKRDWNGVHEVRRWGAK